MIRPGPSRKVSRMGRGKRRSPQPTKHRHCDNEPSQNQPPFPFDAFPAWQAATGRRPSPGGAPPRQAGRYQRKAILSTWARIISMIFACPMRGTTSRGRKPRKAIAEATPRITTVCPRSRRGKGRQEGGSGRSRILLGRRLGMAGTADEGPNFFHGLFEPAQSLRRRQGKPKSDLTAPVAVEATVESRVAFYFGIRTSLTHQGPLRAPLPPSRPPGPPRPPDRAGGSLAS